MAMGWDDGNRESTGSVLSLLTSHSYLLPLVVEAHSGLDSLSFLAPVYNNTTTIPTSISPLNCNSSPNKLTNQMSEKKEHLIYLAIFLILWPVTHYIIIHGYRHESGNNGRKKLGEML